MEEYGLDVRSMFGGCLVLVLVLVILGALVAVPVAFSGWNASKAMHENARAERIDAQARADHLDALDWQRQFMTWTAYLETQDDDIVILLVLVLGALAGGVALGAWGVGHVSKR